MLGISKDIKYPGLNVLPPGVERHVVNGGGLTAFQIFPVDEWNTLHLQIIFYGREYCTARGCDGTKCYLCRTLYPKRKKKFICKKP